MEVTSFSMKLIIALGLSLLSLIPASAKLVTETVDYPDEKGTPLQGFVVYDDSLSGKRPGVIVVHDWRGITDYTHKRADMLAELGYIAFAADIYGKDVRPTTIDDWKKQSSFTKATAPFIAHGNGPLIRRSSSNRCSIRPKSRPLAIVSAGRA
jgi:hypothetical protein